MEMRLSSVDDFEAHRFEAEQRAKTTFTKEKLVISSGSNCDKLTALVMDSVI